MMLIEILESWRLFKKASPANKEMMRKRILICDTCSFKLQITPNGQQLVGTANNPSSAYLCKACGCGLENRIHDPEHICPKGKWTLQTD